MAANVTLNYSATGYTPIGVTTTANNTIITSATIAAGAANVPFADVVFANTALQSVFGYCSGGNLTMKTNNATSPNQTFTLVANTPFAWNTGSPITLPFTSNLTAGIFVTNAGAANVTIDFTWNTN